MKIESTTMIRVCRQLKVADGDAADFGQPELFCIVPFKFLDQVIGFPHRDAMARVKRELEGGSVLSLVYKNDGGSWGSSRTCYAVAIEI